MANLRRQVDMRTLLAATLTALAAWFFPPKGKRRAPAEDVSPAYTPDTADAPTQRLIITHNVVGVGRPTRSPRPPAYLRGEDTPLIRPYLIAYEREQERRRQMDRRTAATLATLGIDFPTHGVTA